MTEDYKIRWGEAVFGLDCVCGAKEIIISHQDWEPMVCDDCGRKFELIVEIKVTPK